MRLFRRKDKNRRAIDGPVAAEKKRVKVEPISRELKGIAKVLEKKRGTAPSSGKAIVGQQMCDVEQGAPHVYDFELYEGIYMAIPTVTSGVNLKASIISHAGFWISTYKGDESHKNVGLIEDWVRYIGLHRKLYHAARDVHIYGNYFAEIVGKKNHSGRAVENEEWGVTDLKRINPKTMFVRQDVKGKLIEYVQIPSFRLSKVRKDTYLTRSYESFEKFQEAFQKGLAPKEKDLIKFKPDEMLHIKINEIAGEIYGVSVIESLRRTLAMILGGEDDLVAALGMHGSPSRHWKVGSDIIPGTTKQVDDVIGSLKGLNPGDDVVTSNNVECDDMSSGTQIANYDQYIRDWRKDLFAGLMVPEVMLGHGGDTSEATAKLQLEINKYDAMCKQDFISKPFEKVFMMVCGIEKLKPSNINDVPVIRWKKIMSHEERYLYGTQMTQMGAMSIQELRRELDMPLEIDGDTYLDIQHKMQIELSRIGAAQKAASAGSNPKPKPGPDQQRKKDRTVPAKKAKQRTDAKRASVGK